MAAFGLHGSDVAPLGIIEYTWGYVHRVPVAKNRGAGFVLHQIAVNPMQGT